MPPVRPGSSLGRKVDAMSSVWRIVRVDFWTDATVVSDFTPEDKFFMLYLLTNPHTTQLGIYEFIPKMAAFEMGYSTDSVMSLLDRFDNKYGIIRYNEKTKEIAIKNYLKHSVVFGGKPVHDLLVKESQSVKEKSLLGFIRDAALSSDVQTVVDLAQSFPVAENESYHESVDDSYPKQKQKQKQNIPADKSAADGFDEFWAAYPRKTAKPKAQAAFNKIHPCSAMLTQMLEAIGAQKLTPQWLKDGGQYIPHPATWLNQERWLDDIPEQKDDGAWEAWKRS